MGGASRLNAMLWTRGHRGDYEAWKEMGLGEWGWDSVEGYFRGLENLDEEKSETRGSGGPIELCKPSYLFKWLKQ